jgi:hypothetical protein
VPIRNGIIFCANGVAACACCCLCVLLPVQMAQCQVQLCGISTAMPAAHLARHASMSDTATSVWPGLASWWPQLCGTCFMAEASTATTLATSSPGRSCSAAQGSAVQDDHRRATATVLRYWFGG